MIVDKTFGRGEKFNKITIPILADTSSLFLRSAKDSNYYSTPVQKLLHFNFYIRFSFAIHAEIPHYPNRLYR